MMVCNGICDLFVIVLEFFVMVPPPPRDLVPYTNSILCISFLSLTGPQGHFSVRPQRGRGSIFSSSP